MAVRIIKGSWWVDITFNYARNRKRSPENSKAGAQAYEAVLRQKLARGESIDDTIRAKEKEQKFARFAQTWFTDYVVSNNKPSEQKTKRYILSASLVPFFGKMTIGKITAHHIEQYKAQLAKEDASPKTIRNRLTILNTCLKTAHEWGLSGTPPKIKWPKCPPPKTDYLSNDECELVLSNSSGIIHEMIFTALKTGMRQGELAGLQWSSIDWERLELTVRHSLDDTTKTLVPPKNNKQRHIPLDANVYEMLFKRKKSTGFVFLDTDGKPLNQKRLGRHMVKIREAIKLSGKKVGWHMFRHTFASHLAIKGVPLHAIKDLMGHASITTTMRYAHLAPSTLRSAIDMLNPRKMVSINFGQPVGNQWMQTQQKELVAKSALLKNP